MGKKVPDRIWLFEPDIDEKDCAPWAEYRKPKQDTHDTRVGQWIEFRRVVKKAKKKGKVKRGV